MKIVLLNHFTVVALVAPMNCSKVYKRLMRRQAIISENLSVHVCGPGFPELVHRWPSWSHVTVAFHNNTYYYAGRHYVKTWITKINGAIEMENL